MNLKSNFVSTFDKSVGKMIRLFQSSLKRESNEKKSVIDYVEESSKRDSASYALQEMQNALVFRNKEDLWRYCLGLIESEARRKNRTALILEFGVWTGHSINYMAARCPEALFVGFDSFEGLEEDWIGTPMTKESFHTNGKIPKVRSNIELVIGKFNQSLPRWLAESDPEEIDLVHIDSDTYQPAKFVLNKLEKILKNGSVVIFDEYFGYPSWRLNEWRAWQETIQENQVKYKYLAYSEQAVAIQIISQSSEV